MSERNSEDLFHLEQRVCSESTGKIQVLGAESVEPSPSGLRRPVHRDGRGGMAKAQRIHVTRSSRRRRWTRPRVATGPQSPGLGRALAQGPEGRPPVRGREIASPGRRREDPPGRGPPPRIGGVRRPSRGGAPDAIRTVQGDEPARSGRTRRSTPTSRTSPRRYAQIRHRPAVTRRE